MIFCVEILHIFHEVYPFFLRVFSPYTVVNVTLFLLVMYGNARDISNNFAKLIYSLE